MMVRTGYVDRIAIFLGFWLDLEENVFHLLQKKEAVEAEVVEQKVLQVRQAREARLGHRHQQVLQVRRVHKDGLDLAE
jgi:hypothetical protein